MDIHVGRLNITDVPNAVADDVNAILNTPTLYVIKPMPDGLELELIQFLLYISDYYATPTLTYDQFAEKLRQSIDAGVLVIASNDAELSELVGRLINCVTKVLGAKVEATPVFSHGKPRGGLYRIVGLFSIGRKWWCIAKNGTSKVVRALIYPMSADIQDISKCYIVPYDGGVYYQGSFSRVKKHEILYVAKKLGRKTVTADDIKQHFDVHVKNGYLQFSDGWTIGDGSPTTAKKLLKYCYLPRPLLHRLFVRYLFSWRRFPSRVTDAYFDNTDGALLDYVGFLAGMTVALGYVKTTFSNVEYDAFFTPIKMRVNNALVYTADMKDILLASYNFTSQSEFDSFLQSVSATPLFLRKLLNNPTIKVEADVSDCKLVVELPITQCGDNVYDIAGVKCTLDVLSYIARIRLHNIYFYGTDVIKAFFFEGRNCDWIMELKEVIRKKAQQIYGKVYHRAKALLQELLDKYRDRLSLTCINGIEGVLVRGKKHTYFVKLDNGETWLVQNNALAKRICIVERIHEYSYLISFDRVISRIVVLLNDDKAAEHIRTLQQAIE